MKGSADAMTLTGVKPAYSISLHGTIARCAPARGSLSYSQELRSLGQALDSEGLVSLELQVKGADYFVRGRARTPKESQSFVLDRLEGMIAKALRSESGPRMRISEVVYQFPPERIWQLEREGRKNRVAPDQTPDRSRLSQLLRTAGWYLDRKPKTSLLELSVKERWLMLSYQTSDGRIERTKAGIEYFYDHWLKMCLWRGRHGKSAPANGSLAPFAGKELRIG